MRDEAWGVSNYGFAVLCLFANKLVVCCMMVQFVSSVSMLSVCCVCFLCYGF